MKEIINVLLEIRETSSSKEKLQILKDNDNPELRKFLKLVYDNKALNFYQKEVDVLFSSAKEEDVSREVIDYINLGAALNSRVLSGHEAKAVIANFFIESDIYSREALVLMLARDVKAGISAKTINKAFEGLIPLSSYMRCSLPKAVKLETWDWDNGVILQTKEDAMFSNVDIASGELFNITSRTGTRYPVDKFSPYFKDISDKNVTFGLDGEYQLHGEMIVYEDGKPLPREKSNGVMNSVEQGDDFGPNQEPVFVVWDIIPLQAAESGATVEIPYYERMKLARQAIEGITNIRFVKTEIVHSFSDAIQINQNKMKGGLEGSILVNPYGFWKDGDSKDKVKLKMEKSVDLIVVGINPGNGKNADTFGSLVMQSSCGRLEVGISGFTDKMRKQLAAMGDSVKGLIMEVVANGIMRSEDPDKPHSLFLPRFKEVRHDKQIPDSYERIEEIFATF